MIDVNGLEIKRFDFSTIQFVRCRFVWCHNHSAAFYRDISHDEARTFEKFKTAQSIETYAHFSTGCTRSFLSRKMKNRMRRRKDKESGDVHLCM